MRWSCEEMMRLTEANLLVIFFLPIKDYAMVKPNIPIRDIWNWRGWMKMGEGREIYYNALRKRRGKGNAGDGDGDMV